MSVNKNWPMHTVIDFFPGYLEAIHMKQCSTNVCKQELANAHSYWILFPQAIWRQFIWNHVAIHASLRVEQVIQ